MHTTDPIRTRRRRESRLPPLPVPCSTPLLLRLFDKTTEISRFPEITSESKVFVPKVTKLISNHPLFLSVPRICFCLWINLHSFTWLWNLLLWMNILVSKELKIIM
jgi:hypothetical protein